MALCGGEEQIQHMCEVHFLYFCSSFFPMQSFSEKHNQSTTDFGEVQTPMDHVDSSSLPHEHGPRWAASSIVGTRFSWSHVRFITGKKLAVLSLDSDFYNC